MDIIIISYLAVLGAVIGSFIGAMVWRLKTRRPVAVERSQCETCKHTLSVFDLIPVLSWLSLRGRCRYCKAPIGVQALLLELGMAIVFTLSYLAWPLELSGLLGWSMFVLWLVVASMLGFLFVYDARYFLLPDVVVKPLIALSAVLFVLIQITEGASFSEGLLEVLLAMLPIAGVYWLLYQISSGKWVGYGDVKLGIALGFLAGWPGAFIVLFLANVLGTLYVVPGLLSGRLSRKKHIPFGPFLILAAFIVFLFGPQITTWYTSLLYL